MKLRSYSAPEAEDLTMCFEDIILITSGADEYHDGGAGYYGDSDTNDNMFVF